MNSVLLVPGGCCQEATDEVLWGWSALLCHSVSTQLHTMDLHCFATDQIHKDICETCVLMECMRLHKDATMRCDRERVFAQNCKCIFALRCASTHVDLCWDGADRVSVCACDCALCVSGCGNSQQPLAPFILGDAAEGPWKLDATFEENLKFVLLETRTWKPDLYILEFWLGNSD